MEQRVLASSSLHNRERRLAAEGAVNPIYSHINEYQSIPVDSCAPNGGGTTAGPCSTKSLWGHLYQEDKGPANHQVESVRQQGYENQNGMIQSSRPKGSSWAPADQPMWRHGSASIWERPPSVSLGSERHALLDHHIEGNQGHGFVHCVQPDQLQPNRTVISEVQQPLVSVEERNEHAGVHPNWYETSEESVELYEDWYYEERELIRDDHVENLASCSTTTGGLQVCRNAAKHWVYPSHIPERKYQLHAISRALFSNTLVCYPTGLGKTLIAAVVMHNFIRWFPRSKVVFIAPTKPLVSQQMKACQNFMGLCASSASEMTGRAKGDDRREAWNKASIRAYFCTPQTFWNDVKRGICPYELISCLVVDECHRATGQADVVQAVKHMRNVQKSKFRVLGLSATPGSSPEQVQEVINSLGINQVVFKDENDKDVAPYVHNKESETHVVNTEFVGNASRSMLMASLQHIVGDLSGQGHYYGVADAERVTRFGMQQARKLYKGGSWMTIQQFVQASILADIRDQLDGYGPKAALSFLQSKMLEEKSLKALQSKDPQFSHFIASLHTAVARGGSNPKIQKLKEILESYFSGENGRKIERAIVFATLRDGVASISDSLESMKPLVRARSFIGQGSGSRKGGGGMKQSEQKQVLAEFTSGECNVLVATCIGEEGLDIPNVDLIICFDAISSPTRALQRQGRTGRHGDGKVIYLVTAGQEEERFNKSAQAMKTLHAQLKEADRYFSLNESAVRMLPREFTPKLAHVVLEKHQNDKFDSEEVPLAVRLDQMRQEIQKKTQAVPMDEIPPDTAVQMGHNQSSVMDDEADPISRKRQNFLLESQSPNACTKGSSPLSLEALSIIERVGKTPGSNEANMPVKNFSRLCKARDISTKVSETFPGKKRNVKKQRVSTRFIDAEAVLSGSDSGEEQCDDSDAQEFLNDFIYDGTPERDSMAIGNSDGDKRMPLPHFTNSPSPGQLMNFIRSRKRGILLSQSQSFRATPDEYDIADSFINDSSVEFESSDDALLDH